MSDRHYTDAEIDALQHDIRNQIGYERVEPIIAQLRRERDEAIDNANSLHAWLCRTAMQRTNAEAVAMPLLEERDRLRAEVERLRKVAKAAREVSCPCVLDEGCGVCARCTLRAALDALEEER